MLNKRKPMTMKSAMSQFTSSVSCIAVKGISNITPVTIATLKKALLRKMMTVVLMFIVIPLCCLNLNAFSKYLVACCTLQ